MSPTRQRIIRISILCIFVGLALMPLQTVRAVDLTPPSVTVTSPNRGERLKVGERGQIRWTVSDDVGIKGIIILLSTDGGIIWSTVADNLSAGGEPYPRPGSFSPGSVTITGSYDWQVPDISSTNCFIRVDAFDTAGNRGTDMSDRAFTIERIPDTTPPTVRLLSPNGGEFWRTGETQTISWEASDPLNAWEMSDNPDRVKIEIYYSYNGGRRWSKVPDRFPLSNTGFYRWYIPHGQSESYPLENCLVEVRAFDLAGNRSSDISEEAFTIGEMIPPTVRVVRPNGGEVWKVGERRIIDWGASDNVAVSTVDISLKTACGSIDERIATGLPNTGFYSWIVPNRPSPHAQIYITVRDPSGNEATDASNMTFTIEAIPVDTQPPSLTIISPPSESVVKGGTGFALLVRATDNVGLRDFTIKVNNIVRNTIARSGTDIRQTLRPVVYGTERHVITVIATDASGNTAERDIGIYSDDASPTISNISPPPGTDDDPHRVGLRTSQRTVGVRADVVDRGMAGVKQVRLWDASGRILATQAVPYSGNTYILEFSRPAGASSTECYLEALDKVGNVSRSNMITIVWEEPGLELKQKPIIIPERQLPKLPQ